MELTLERHPASVLSELAPAWDALAERAGSPFLTTAWLSAWTAARAPRTQVWTLVDESGRLRAGACLRRTAIGLASATDEHTGLWTVLGEDEVARAALWRAIAGRLRHSVVLDAVPAGACGAEAARRALQDAGYSVTVRVHDGGPRRVLPETSEELLASLSRGLRSQYRRRSRALGRLGRLELRTSTTASAEQDLATFLALEASGWKRRRRSAILCHPSTAALYRGWATAAAREGTLRLQLLELDGRAVAGDLSCAYAGGVHMLKTAYDERLAERSPGLVLRGMALESAIDDGFGFYDFLGGAETYKVRWGGPPSQVASVRAYRGPVGALPHGYQQSLRPALRRVVQVARREAA